ncbi:MAG: site-specific DNA-methyltransferase [Thermodesulforhabdaceae bacterium]
MQNKTDQTKQRASRNKTITLTEEELNYYRRRLIRLNSPATLETILDKTIHQDLFEILEWLPSNTVDLLFVDPPYNLYKSFNGHKFTEKPLELYEQWLDSWLSKLVKVLKDTASVYICGDWRSSSAIHRVGEKYFKVRNRITWEREKGRGSKANWKNCSEDIWFFTVSDTYTFNVESVKLVRRVIAPYTTEEGEPKDWIETKAGRFRLTYPSNIWTDITVPFWSMPENTEHPTQKPEKLLAKIILASSNPGDVILDPFLGSGTTSVVASKLGRHYIGIEIDEHYCCIAEKRIDMAKMCKDIQGYSDGVFWDRNILNKSGRCLPDIQVINAGVTNSQVEQSEA